MRQDNVKVARAAHRAMQDGRIAVLQIYLDRAAALADAGLGEQP